jgi:hypothetical protein
MKYLILSLVLVGFGAFAQVPEPQIAGSETVAATAALLSATQKNLTEFKKLGNTVTQISSESSSRTEDRTLTTTTVWKFERKQCHTEGFVGYVCLGGGQLTVTIQDISFGGGIRTEVESSLLRYRSGPPR